MYRRRDRAVNDPNSSELSYARVLFIKLMSESIRVEKISN